MISHPRSIALGAICTAATLAATTAFAQVPGIYAYSSSPSPATQTLYSSPLIGPSGVPIPAWNVRHVRARNAIAAGDFDMARRLLGGSLGRSSDAEAHYLAGVAQSGLGEVSEARDLFAAAVAADEDHLGARLGLALTDLRLGNRDRAAAALAWVEAQRARCAGICREAVGLERAQRVISHFLNAPQDL